MPTSHAGTRILTVVTFNLWHDQHDWPKRLNVIVAEMRRIRPDVLCLQEVLQNPTLRNQAETLGGCSAPNPGRHHVDRALDHSA